MDIWLYWVIAALLLFIVELFTSGFAVICLSIGAIGGAIAAANDASIEMQLLTFAPLAILTPRNRTQFSTSPSMTQPSAAIILLTFAPAI